MATKESFNMVKYKEFYTKMLEGTLKPLEKAQLIVLNKKLKASGELTPKSRRFKLKLDKK